MWNFPKIQNTASKSLQIAIFDLLKSAKMVSRKICVVVKIWNFHIVFFSKVVLITFFSFDIQTFFFVKVHARKDKKTEGNPLILLMMVGRNRKLIWVTCDREINPLQSQVPFSHAKTTQIRFYFWDLWNLGGLFYVK